MKEARCGWGTEGHVESCVSKFPALGGKRYVQCFLFPPHLPREGASPVRQFSKGHSYQGSLSYHPGNPHCGI